MATRITADGKTRIDSGGKTRVAALDAFSLTDYNIWLANPEAERVMLLIIEHRDFTAYISSHGYQTEPTDILPNIAFDPRLHGSPEITLSVPFLGETRGELAVSSISIDNKDGELDSWRGDSDGFIDRHMTILIGATDWPYSRFLLKPLTMIIDEIDFSGDDLISFSPRDMIAELDGPLQTNLYTVGPLKEQPIPQCWGLVRNAELVNRAPSISGGEFQGNDGEQEEYTAVYDNGVLLTISSGYTLNLAGGYLTKVYRPVGTMTADMKGVKTSGVWLNTTADIAQDMMVTYGPWTTDRLALDTFAQLNLDAPYTMGIQAVDRINRIEAIDLLLDSVGAVMFPNSENKLALGRIEDPAGKTAVAALGPVDIIDLEISPLGTPHWRTRIGHEKNWTVQRSDQLAGSASDPDFSDAERVAWLAQEYRVVSWPSGATAVLGKRDPPVFNTLIDSAADGQTECQRRHGILGGEPQKITIEGYAGPFSFGPTDVLEVTDDRYGLEAGENIQVLEVAFRPLDNDFELRGWFNDV